MTLKFDDSVRDLLVLTTDVGTSGSKMVYEVIQSGYPSKSELLLMEPELAESSAEVIEEQYESERISSPQPENEAWVEYGEDCYVVGFLAKRKFHGTVERANLKYEGAIPKVLAAVGVIAEKVGLADSFDLALSIPLPYNEWKTREQFERAISLDLSNFNFRRRSLSVNLKFFLCVPEGGGLAITRARKLGAAFETKKIVVIMFGYRDISILLFERGIPTGFTVTLGMAEMIDLVTRRTSGLEADSLLRAIHQTGTNIKPKNFEHLAKSRNAEFKASEVNQIAEAVRKSRSEHWQRVLKWLCSQIPLDVEEVIIGGGTAEYFQSELKALCSKRFPKATLSWAAELEEDVRQVFNLPPNKDALIARLTDAYGLFRFTHNQVLPYITPVRRRG